MALAAGIIACSGSPNGPGGGTTVGLQVQFKPSLMTSLIDSVELQITYLPDGESQIETPTVHEGRILDTLLLSPGESVEFYLTALDETGTILYEAYDTLEIVSGAAVNATLSMQPVVSMLRPSPMYRHVTMGETAEFSVDIYVYNVSEVFNAAFRLEYDPTALEAIRVEPGTYLGSDIFMAPNILDNYVAVGITRIPPAAGGVEDDSGHLATIYFSPVTTGESVLNFDASRVSLLTADGQPIPEMDAMVLETGTVVVNPGL